MPQNSSIQALSQALIETIRRSGDLTDPRIEAAFKAVPRHIFLPEMPLEQAYANDAIPIQYDEYGKVTSSASQPGMIAAMLCQLQLRPGDNVLEIGTGTGYNAALMQHIVGDSGNVTSVELEPTLIMQLQANMQHAGAFASRVTVVQGDGATGYAARAQYDRIIASVGIWDVPDAWVRQLKPGGILVAPIWVDGFQVSGAFAIKPDGTLFSRDNIPCGFINLRGLAAGPPLSSRITAGSSLTLHTHNIDKIDGAALRQTLLEDHEVARVNFPLTSADYWYSFLPYLVLNCSERFTFATYSVDPNQQAYGLSQSGFALIGPASACFVGYDDAGLVNCFGGAEAFIGLDEAVNAWDKAGRPQIDALRVRLVPITDSAPSVGSGKLHRRHEHYLHFWLDSAT